MRTWQLHAAKARFYDVLQRACEEGPQEITMHGRPVAVVVSREMFERLSGGEESLVNFMRRSPLYGLEDVHFERDRSAARNDQL